MPDTSNGISGTAVAVASVGAVLVYAGFRNVSLVQALRDLTSGKPPAVQGKSTDVTTGPGGGGGTASGFGDARRSSVVSATSKYTGDVYSQAKRTQAGFSDCSSFVDKALKDAGIQPPQSPWASTANYRMSPEWKTIPASQALPGDIAISAAHMVLITTAGGASGIGQQKPGVNVRTGTMATLFGSQSFVYKTWTGYSATPAVSGGGGGGGAGSW
jgi:hypothetical protein